MPEYMTPAGFLGAGNYQPGALKLASLAPGGWFDAQALAAQAVDPEINAFRNYNLDGGGGLQTLPANVLWDTSLSGAALTTNAVAGPTTQSPSFPNFLSEPWSLAVRMRLPLNGAGSLSGCGLTASGTDKVYICSNFLGAVYTHFALVYWTGAGHAVLESSVSLDTNLHDHLLVWSPATAVLTWYIDSVVALLTTSQFKFTDAARSFGAFNDAGAFAMTKYQIGYKDP